MFLVNKKVVLRVNLCVSKVNPYFFKSMLRSMPLKQIAFAASTHVF